MESVQQRKEDIVVVTTQERMQPVRRNHGRGRGAGKTGCGGVDDETLPNFALAKENQMNEQLCKDLEQRLQSVHDRCVAAVQWSPRFGAHAGQCMRVSASDVAQRAVLSCRVCGRMFCAVCCRTAPLWHEDSSRRSCGRWCVVVRNTGRSC